MANENLKKAYDHKEVDKSYMNRWMEKGYFRGEVDKEKEPFTIVIPPPNITGQLHMGHALDNMMQDALIRFKRMQGYAGAMGSGNGPCVYSDGSKNSRPDGRGGFKKRGHRKGSFLRARLEMERNVWRQNRKAAKKARFFMRLVQRKIYNGRGLFTRCKGGICAPL